MALAWALAVLVVPLAGGCRGGRAPEGSPRPLPVVVTAGGVEMVHVPAGWFVMGSDRGKPQERPAHRVWVDSFLIDRHEVTQDQFRRLKLPDPSHFKGPLNPVEHIAWTDAVEFCNERSAAEGLRKCYAYRDGTGTWDCDFDADGYRLPTEAEWEYACRAGTTSERFFGRDDEATIRAYAWYAANSGRRTQPVGGKPPNPWGLHDMYGNVAEWCQDWYDPNYYAASPQRNPRGPARGRLVVLRGGSWDSGPEWLRSSARAGEDPRFNDVCFARDTIGLRCVRRPTRR